MLSTGVTSLDPGTLPGRAKCIEGLPDVTSFDLISTPKRSKKVEAKPHPDYVQTLKVKGNVCGLI